MITFRRSVSADFEGVVDPGGEKACQARLLVDPNPSVSLHLVVKGGDGPFGPYLAASRSLREREGRGRPAPRKRAALGPGNEGIATEKITQALIGGFGDSDPRGDYDTAGTITVVADPKAPGR
jgi:hypothetical protein